VAYNNVNKRNATHVTSNATVLLRTMRPNSLRKAKGKNTQMFFSHPSGQPFARAKSPTPATKSTPVWGSERE